jgi:PP-loop superfamily ATP-utilizing enzyme
VRHFEFSGDGNTNKMLKLAKVDFHEKDLHKALNEEKINLINVKLKELGYDFVTLDMAGLKSGSLNLERIKK